MRIAFIASNYPSASRPGPGAFVREFVRSMARHGHECDVISPVGWLDRRHGPYPPLFSEEDVAGRPPIRVHRPRYLSCSHRNLGWTHTGRWTNACFARAVQAVVAGLAPPPQIVYGHFLYPAGHAAVRAARRIGACAIVGVGEGEFWSVEAVGFPRAAEEMKEASAFLAVSTCIAEGLVSRLGIPRDKIGVFPNGVDPAVFRPGDRAEACRQLGISADFFHVGFVGSFIPQKGYPELIQAVAGLSDVRLVLLGRGPHPANDPQTAFCGSVPHEDVPRCLRACDAFVLPTRIEGSSNSIIEAMACGLPIVTSNGRHMDDIVDDRVAIRVDPADVAALRAAIRTLREDADRRTRMSVACRQKALELDIGERARRVTAWMGAVAARASERQGPRG